MIHSLIERLPIELLKQLQDCPQSPKWHSEGSVYNHTILVAQNLPNNLDLQACALFHDMGKIFKTKVEEKEDRIKISAIGHEMLVNAYVATYAGCFEDMDINWEMVVEVGKQHMRMHKYLDGTMTNPRKRLEIECMRYFHELKLVAEADMKGRSHIVRPVLILTVGIPGSGKTTWAKGFCQRSGYDRICPDDIREEVTGNISDISRDREVWDLAFDRTEELLNEGKSIVFDATNVNSKIRREICYRFDDKAVILYKLFPCDKEEAKRRIKADIEKKVNRSNVPEEVVDRMAEKWYNSQEFFKNSLRIIK